MKKKKRWVRSVVAFAAVFFLTLCALPVTSSTDIDAAPQSWFDAMNNPDGNVTLEDVTGVGRADFVAYMEAHKADFLGKAYALESYGGWTCAVFVGKAMEAAGCRNLPAARNLVYSYTDMNKDLQIYLFYSKDQMMKSGVLEKGDIIISNPTPSTPAGADPAGLWAEGVDQFGNYVDAHIGFFWGETSSDDKYWHSTHGYDSASYIPSKDIYEYDDPAKAKESKTSGAVPKSGGAGITRIPVSGNAGGNMIGPFTPKSDSFYLVVKWGSDVAFKLRKNSAQKDITVGNRCYSLAGAVYGVYRDAGCTDLVERITTKDDGCTETVQLSCGDYWVKELQASPGYYLDDKTYQVSLERDQELSVQEVPAADPLSLLLKKVDAETGGAALGAAELSGAEYAVKYYDVQMRTDPGAGGEQAKYSWIFRTDEKGEIALDEAHKVEGPPLVRDAAGRAVLPVGTVTIRETKASKGYLLSSEVFVANTVLEEGRVVTSGLPNAEQAAEEQVMRGDFSMRKIDADTQRKMGGVSFALTALDADGREIETQTFTTDANGFFSSESSYAPHSRETNSGTPRTGLWFGAGAAVDDSRRALPYGTYILRELAGENNSGHELYEDRFEIYGDNIVVSLGNIEDQRKTPQLGTQASDGETGSHVGTVSKTAVIRDVIRYRDLPLEELTFTGTLVEAGSGKPILDAEGKESTASTVEKIEQSEGEVTVTFSFDSTALGGRDVVVFETVTDAAGTVIGEHRDPNDEEQTVKYPEIGTTATDGDTGEHSGTLSEKAVIRDVVEYQNLSPGHTYRVTGTVADRESGELLPEVTAFTEFVPEKEEGQVVVTLSLNTLDMQGRDLVVFERLSVRTEEEKEEGEKEEQWKEIVIHEDLSNTSQTVRYPLRPAPVPGKAQTNTGKTVTPARTGDTQAAQLITALAALALSAALLVQLRRLRR